MTTALHLQPGTRLHGFRVTDITPLPELNTTLIQLIHENTGARMVHLDCEDDNNLFGVGFRTTPEDSTGVAHILEHTALCGSRRYPVRDPFFSMLKRSLNTFMNALTSSDWTLYPFSSQNETDFYNLMDIYLDAAFFPLLRERDFRQEGHRVEFAEPENPESPLTFKGVVYNEMKGAMADPGSLLHRRLTHALYPTTTYGFNSGGEPENILDLTHEELKAFHGRYYHPSNAWFFTYGNLPLSGHLAVIEEQALKHFQSLQVDSEVPAERRYTEPRRFEGSFPVDPGEPMNNRSMVQVAWLTCPISDSFQRLAMTLLSQLLLGNSAAPLYKALLDSGLGQNLAPGTGYHDDNRETYFAAGLQGTDPDKVEEIECLVLATLEQVASTGFKDEQIEAAIHQLEFSHREVVGDQYPYALLLLMRMMGPWLHDGDPVSPLLLDDNLAKLRQELADGPFFSELIRSQLLENGHRVTLLLAPDAAQKEREERQVAARLAALEAGLDERARQEIVARARELQEAQEAEENLDCLPTLQLSDIPAEERPVTWELEQEADVPVYWFNQPTNGIAYFAANLELNDLPRDLLPHVPLFCSLLPKIGAAGYSYLEMAERITAATGGVHVDAGVLSNPFSLDQYQLSIEIRSKALLRNRDRMFDILSDICRSPDFTDLKRLHTVINQVKTSLENSVPGSGHSYAARAAAAALSPGNRLREEWGGLHLIRQIKSVAARSPEQLGELADKLQQLARLAFASMRLRCAVTAEREAFADIRPSLERFFGALAADRSRENSPVAELPLLQRAVGWAAPVPVSYVARVFPTVPLTHPDSAGLMVLAKLLRSGYLHREVREKGGAYGGMANFDAHKGLLSMLSYRDPHLLRTLDVYRGAAEWAASGRYGEEDIREAILAVFSNLDRPLSPGGKGHRDFEDQLQGVTREMRKIFRERVLAVDRAHLMELAEGYLLQRWAEGAVAVVSAEELLQQANRQLGQTLTLEKL
ncbi:MAG: insulinase family protein [Syntrophotaleaceae bacterium]